MSWPSIKQFGISDNPLIDTPFVETQIGGSSPPVFDYFLLLNGMNFGLLNGGNLLLLNSS